ncbi:MAG: hypothetical protein NW203_09240 [Hyphomonadaceae bacterium]|nr:hypothetical protein [Hyphomonadaceae bacterium]
MKNHLLIAALVLAACSRQPAPEAAPQAETPTLNLTIGPGGAAGITSAIAMTTAAVSAAAPGFVVAEAQDQIEGDTFTKITLSADGAVVFDVLPNAERTAVHSIETASPRAIGPAGERIGALFGDAPAAEVLFCVTPEQHAAYDFACSTAADGRFWRGYDLPDSYVGPRAPFEDIDADAAVRATLVEMRWVAPG